MLLCHHNPTSRVLVPNIDLLTIAEAVTTNFLYTLIETGTSLVAVNLPASWFLVTSVTLQRVIRTIQLCSGSNHYEVTAAGVVVAAAARKRTTKTDLRMVAQC